MSTQKPILTRVADETGITTLLATTRDAQILIAQRFVRLFAYGASTLVLTLLLSAQGVSEARIGLFMSMTLWGDVAISFLLTVFADAIGRRRILVVGGLLMTLSGAVFATFSNYWILVAASVLGVITPSGNEIGPFKAIEESTLAQLTPKEGRSDVFAWYMMCGMIGVAGGNVVAGWCVQALQTNAGWSDVSAYRMVFVFYAGVGLLKAVLSLMLSANCEAEAAVVERQANEHEEGTDMDAAEAAGLLSDDDEDEHDNDNNNVNRTDEDNVTTKPPRPPRAFTQKPLPLPPLPPPPPTKQNLIQRIKSLLPSISRESISILWKLSILFAIDSGASGLVPPSWLIYWFKTTHGVSEGGLGTLFFATNIVASASQLVASALAKRIGLVKTMVFTHMPSAISLALIPAPRATWAAMMFLIMRTSTSSMDQAPRQAFLAAVVLPSERTAVMGYINVVKTLAQSVGPYMTGLLASAGKFWVAFVLAGSMKIGYDLTMLGMFQGYKFRE